MLIYPKRAVYLCPRDMVQCFSKFYKQQQLIYSLFRVGKIDQKDDDNENFAEFMNVNEKAFNGRRF